MSKVAALHTCVQKQIFCECHMEAIGDMKKYEQLKKLYSTLDVFYQFVNTLYCLSDVFIIAFCPDLYN